MIIWYFCRQFLVAFLIVLGVLTAVLSAVNVVGKNIFSSPELIVVLFVGALPFMAVFAYPFALLSANLMVFYAAQQKNELVLVSFFTRLRQQILCGSLVNSLLVTMFFAPLILFIAPQSYDWGKQLLYVVIEQKISTLSPGLLHFPMPGIVLYFEESSQRGAITELHNFFLIQHGSIHFASQNTHHDRDEKMPILESVMWGERVLMSDKKIVIKAGSLVGFDKKDGGLSFVASFDDGLLDLEKLFVAAKIHATQPAKYQTIKTLWHACDVDAVVERFRRYLQMLWIFLTPLCAYLLALFDYVRTIPFVLAAAGGWFFLLYGLLLCVPMTLHLFGMWGLYFLFLVPILMLVCLYGCSNQKNF